MPDDNSLYKHLLDNLNTAILLVNAELQLTYINPAAEVLLQVSAARIHGQAVSQLFSEDDGTIGGLKKALRTGVAYTKRQTRLRLPLRQDITVDYSITPVDDKEHSLIMEIQPLDRMMRISKEKSLLASQKTTRMLVRGLAHEIKNPLGGLRGAAQLLARELPSTELQDYTNIIIEEADRLRNLVDQMLGPHRLPDKKPINIHEVLERVYHLISAETQGAITLIRDYDPSIPNLICDKEQLIQAVLNIARNAMQVLQDQEDGTITLRSRIQRQITIDTTLHRLVCRVDIIDNGPGIPANITDNIFFPMVSGRADGTGLGLSISQSIISQHSGLIKCTSEPGNTVFTLYLPMEPTHE
jgi:two-component system nitrogen regulation sensor histidine kinase GlnL